ncbi:MAG: hypothetical protein E5X72_01595 [Mesorhizobium sp.]|uniref:hypothetical protein n=1 Tax=Mesorhizobium sp. TaxID=1871066 RepID=UPI001214C3FB|nr:hypothetical protein [Mesorhizobium sp.]TIP06438.1 MAG: hypothetical protein E5X72_01595 [Mesorhizobium sp.]
MHEITEIAPALECLFSDYVPRADMLITTTASQQIADMHRELMVRHSFKLPRTKALLLDLIEANAGYPAGVVYYPEHLVDLYISTIATMIKLGQEKVSLLAFLRTYLHSGHISWMVALEKTDGAWFLVSLPEFEQQHDVRMRVRIPEAA